MATTATAKFTLPPGATVLRAAPPAPPCCLYVAHQGAAKLVGKLLTHRKHGSVFLHEHKPNQRHRATNCPAPLELALVRDLAAWGVAYLYCFEREDFKATTGTLRRIATAAVLAAPPAEYDGRLRYYPPEGEWAPLPGVTVRRQGRDRLLLGPDGLPVILDVRTDRAYVVAEGEGF
jgi:hypothetical protein